MKRIAILGCGAMGTILGAYLSKSGLAVDMFDSWKTQVDALNAKGARVVGRADFVAPVRAMLTEEMEGIYDLVFLMTKQTANTTVLPALLPHLGPDSVVCTLQNGVPEPFVAKYVGEDRTVGGTMIWSATFVEPGVSALTMDLQAKFERGEDAFTVGEMNGEKTERIEKIAAILRRMGGPVTVVDNLMDSRWQKLVINCCCSGMSAATASTFHDATQHPRSNECASFIAYELALCAHADGRDLGKMDHLLRNPEAAGKFFFDRYARGGEGKASMLQDLEAGRPTEVDMINGYICEMGDKYGIDTPYNDAVVSIVHRMERGELPRSQSNLQYFPSLKY